MDNTLPYALVLHVPIYLMLTFLNDNNQNLHSLMHINTKVKKLTNQQLQLNVFTFNYLIF